MRRETNVAPLTSTDPVTLGEVSRNVAELSLTVKDGFKDIGDKVEKRPTWSDVRGIETVLLERIRKLEATWRWIATTVGGAVILAVLALVFKP